MGMGTGYSTHLYAIDIDELKAAVGSKDDALLERVREAVRQRSGVERPVDPTKGPRVRVTAQSEIYLNGRLLTPDEFKEELLNPEWAGTNMYLYQPELQRRDLREGEFKELGSFMRFLLLTVAPFFEERGLIFKKHIIGINGCNTEEDFLGLRDPDDDPTEDEALAELIDGKPKRKDCAHVYGYALEHLCLTLGEFLDSVGTDRLRSMQVKRPLSKNRSPIKLPKSDDFPYVSCLDAGELRTEVERLRAMDFSFPSDEEVEEERKYFLQLLEQAVNKNRCVVGFYY
jgi:hypothetical protein